MSELLCIDDSCILLSDKEPWEGLLWYQDLLSEFRQKWL